MSDFVEISKLKTNPEIMVRSVKPYLVDRHVDVLKQHGYDDSRLITINQNFEIIDGHHRVNACVKVGIVSVPVLMVNVNDDEAKKRAIRSNFLNDEGSPMTLVDLAEFIWRQQSTQKITADILGWRVAKVKNYAAWNLIDEKAWAVIVTTFDNAEKSQGESVVANKVTSVTFSEGLLRNILDLTDWQQLELVTDLAAGNRLIRHSTTKDSIVLDPFACTGTFLIAASKAGLKTIGGDISADNLKIAEARGCNIVLEAAA